MTFALCMYAYTVCVREPFSDSPAQQISQIAISTIMALSVYKHGMIAEMFVLHYSINQQTRLPPVVESFRPDDTVFRSTGKSKCTAL